MNVSFKGKTSSGSNLAFLIDIEYLAVMLEVSGTLKHSGRFKKVFFDWKAPIKNAMQIC